MAMSDWAPWLTQGSPWVFLGTGIMAIITGRLIPARVLEARMKDKNEQIEQWRTAYQSSEESRKIGDQQIDKLLEQGRTTNILLAGLSKPGGGGAS